MNHGAEGEVTYWDISISSIVPKASNPIFAGALTKTAKNVTNGPGGVPGGVANFVGTNSYQNGHFVRG
jgi:hypothetical protein